MNRARHVDAAAAAVAPRRWQVDVARHWPEVAARWMRLAEHGAALPFQRETWLGGWYATQAGAEAEPLLATVHDADRGADVMALPLVVRWERGLRVVAFADGGLTDYNAPILGPGAPVDADGAASLWSALLPALPPADLVEFEKMPFTIDGRTNPLVLIPGARDSHLGGNLLHVPGAWDDWHRRLERCFRKELERSWRVFARHDGAAFRRLTGGPLAAQAWTELKRLQSARIRERHLPYILDEPRNAAFYDCFVAQGLAQGRAVLTALIAGQEVVAALLGVADGRHYAMVRLATAGERWKHCSPGRLLIERTMRDLHRDGYRRFDFTIGDYDYKRRLGVTPVPLAELRVALSWRGGPAVAADLLRHEVRRHDRLAEMLRRLRRTARHLLDDGASKAR